MTSRVCLVALLVCVAALVVAADPARNNDHRRGRYHALRRHSLHGARSHQAPTYAAPEEQAELVEEQPQEDAEPQDDAELQDDAEEEEITPAPVKAHKPRARGGRPATPSGGATAIANAVSKGNGAKSDSRANAYHGDFSGGQFH